MATTITLNGTVGTSPNINLTPLAVQAANTNVAVVAGDTVNFQTGDDAQSVGTITNGNNQNFQPGGPPVYLWSNSTSTITVTGTGY